MLSKFERIQNAIKGDKVDRYPFSFWTHLPDVDLDPVKLAEATYDFYKTFDFDLIKTMNNGMYAIEDYGCEIDYSEIKKGGVGKLINTPIKTYEDFKKIQPLKLDDSKAFKRELYSLQLLLDKVKDENIPVIFTVFSPLTIANKLCGGKIFDYIENDKDNLVSLALDNILKTNIELVKAANNLGASGVFLATQMANYDICSIDVYKKYGAYYDCQMLKESNGFANILHCHGNNIMFELLKDYPTNIFNWHAHESKPDLLEARQTNKCLMAGIVRNDITNSNWDNIKGQIDELVNIYHGDKHIISPGCVIRYPINKDILLQISDYIKNIKL